jgi:hypothetical protein
LASLINLNRGWIFLRIHPNTIKTNIYL